MQYVTLRELADELGLDRSNMRKYVLKHGLTPMTLRTPESHGQVTLALTTADAEAVRALRESQGFGKTLQPVENGEGVFYVVQLVPDLDSSRVKLGFTASMIGRLDAHRTAAPTAMIAGTWPCRRSWEGAAIASVTRTGCTLIANEVYQCDALDALLERCIQFFAVMPNVAH